ncbi:MAG: tetratricopeptide repeat protein [Archangiaceae bacterium]|nr:tetratricopeptide repeat protein [Archangiaceae bacterium]
MKPMLAAVVALAAVLSAPAAFACGNSMRHQLMEQRENFVASASKAYRDGRYTDAVATAEQGLAAAPSAGERRALLRTLGLSNLKLGRFDKSADSFGALLNDKKEPFVQAKLAESQLRQAEQKGTVDDAAKTVLEKQAADGMLADADAWTALAAARNRAGDVAGARAACEKALSVQPEHPEAKQLLSTLTTPKPASEPLKPTSKS